MGADGHLDALVLMDELEARDMAEVYIPRKACTETLNSMLNEYPRKEWESLENLVPLNVVTLRYPKGVS